MSPDLKAVSRAFSSCVNIAVLSEEGAQLIGNSTEEDLGFNTQQGDNAELVYLLGILHFQNPDPLSNSPLFRNPAPPPDDTQDPPIETPHLEDITWVREEDLEVGSRQDPDLPVMETDDTWLFPGDLTPQAKKLILAKVLEVGVRTTFSKHIYLFHNTLYKQENNFN